MSQELVEHLAQISSLSKEAVFALSSIIRAQQVRKNQDLQQIGQTCKTLYFLKSGLARIYYFHEGNDITEDFYGPFCLIARAESLFAGLPSKKAIQVLEDAEVWAISTMELFALYEVHREIERLFTRMFERAYVQTIQRIENLQFHSAEERYQLLVQEQPEVLRRVPLKFIASYLGITQVSLSRIRAKKI
jgi:CRP-like cAMP-binding protein